MQNQAEHHVLPLPILLANAVISSTKPILEEYRCIHLWKRQTTDIFNMHYWSPTSITSNMAKVGRGVGKLDELCEGLASKPHRFL